MEESPQLIPFAPNLHEKKFDHKRVLTLFAVSAVSLTATLKFVGQVALNQIPAVVEMGQGSTNSYSPTLLETLTAGAIHLSNTPVGKSFMSIADNILEFIK